MNIIASAMGRIFGGRQQSSFSAPSVMTREHASLERMFQLFATLPDPDEALRRAGIRREQLRAVEMDDEVTAALDTRREAVLGTPWRLEGGTARLRTSIDAELRRNMEPLLRGAFAAVPYGYSVLEVIYRNDGGRAGLAAVVEKPFEWFVPAADGITARWLRPGADMAGEPQDPRKFLVTVRQGTLRNPYGEALLSRAYWPWFFRMQGWQFWMRWLERYGTPLLLGTTAGDTQSMANNLADALSGSALAVGMGDKVEAVQVTAGTSHFQGFDDVICRRIQKIILGQTLTTDASSGGSFAAAKVADGVRTDRRNADLRLVSATVQRLVNALWEFNGGGGDAPKFVMADDTGLEHARAERDAILVEKVGVRLSPEYVAERYDLEPGEFTMKALDAAPPPPPLDGQAPGGVPSNGSEFAASGGWQFTPVQRGIEDGLAALRPLDPIAPELVRSAVLAARDEADLYQRLAALVPEADPRFSAALERASFAAEVLGFVAAEEQRT